MPYDKIGGGGNSTPDNVTNTYIPVKLSDAFENSPLSWSGVPGENIISSETIEVPPGTIQVGEGLSISAAGVIPIFRSLLTGIQYIPPLFIYDPDGSSGQPFKLLIDAPTTLIVQPDFSISTPLTGTFTNVATSSEFITKLGIKTGTIIDSVTDSAGVARFNYSSGPQIVSGETANIDGFVINTGYNASGVVTAHGSGYFEISSVAFGTDESGGSFVGPNNRILSGVRLQFVSQTTTEPIYYFPSKAGWEVDEGDDLTADGSGDIVVDLSEAPIGLLAGETIDVNYKIDSGVLLGTGTLPYQEVVRQIATFIDMVSVESSVTVLSDVSDAGSGAIITTAERTKLNNTTPEAPNDGKQYARKNEAWAEVEDASTDVTLASDDTTQETLNLVGQELSVDLATTTTDGAMAAEDKDKLDGIEAGAEVNNISDANATDLTGAGDTTLHYHESDRDRANHTGTQTASTISDLDSAIVAISGNNYTEISAGHTHAESTNYIVDTLTPAATVTINIPYEELSSFTVRDETKEFDVYNCIVTIRDALDAIVHTATLNKRDKGWIFYNSDGTENGWRYGEIGKGLIIDIASDHVASTDFGDVYTDTANFDCRNFNVGACYEDPAFMMSVPGAFVSKEYADGLVSNPPRLDAYLSTNLSVPLETETVIVFDTVERSLGVTLSGGEATFTEGGRYAGHIVLRANEDRDPVTYIWLERKPVATGVWELFNNMLSMIIKEDVTLPLPGDMEVLAGDKVRVKIYYTKSDATLALESTSLAVSLGTIVQPSASISIVKVGEVTP